MENKNQNNYLISQVLCVLSSILKQWRIIIVIGCLCGVLLDTFKTITYTPMYNAKAQCAIVYGGGSGVLQGDIDHASESIKYLLNSQYIKNKVNHELEQESFKGTVGYYLTEGTNFCSISINAYTQKDAYFQLESLISIYQEVSENYSFGYNLTLVEDISFSNTPMNSNSHYLNYRNGMLLGVVLTVAVIALLSYFKDTVKDSSEVNDKIDVKLFAKIPKEMKKYKKLFDHKKTAILVSQFKTGFSYIEALNKLASKVDESARKNNYKTILITSALENEGKSSVAINLAISLAKNKKKVLVIDADLRKPSMHKILERNVEYSFVDVLTKEKKWKDTVVSLEKEHIDVIFSKVTENSQELLSQLNLKVLFGQMKKYYDYIIIDSAPSRYIADTSIIAGSVDATYVVVKQDEATCKVINDTIYHLTNADGNVVGTIYNSSVYNPFKSHSSYGYRYGYYRYHRERRSK